MSGIHKLNDRKIKSLKPGQAKSDGGGLNAKCTSTGTVSFLFRKMVADEMVNIGLGSYPDVTLAQAREKAERIRAAIDAGEDPRAALKVSRKITNASSVPTFLERAEEYLQNRTWNSEKTRRGWERSLLVDAKHIHRMHVTKITPDDIFAMINPIWSEKRETAERLRSRVEIVFRTAVARQVIQSNPADWQIIKVLLEDQHVSTAKQVNHHAALPYSEIPALYAYLEKQGTMTAMLLQVIILTGLRWTEAKEAQWLELNLWDVDLSLPEDRPERQGMTWHIPAERMKKKHSDHFIPISSELLRVLRKVMVTTEEQGGLDQVHEDWRIEALVRREKHRLVYRTSRDHSLGWATQGPNRLEQIFKSTQSKSGYFSETSVRNMINRSPWAGELTVHGNRASLRQWLSKQDIAHEVAEAALHHKERDETVQAYTRSESYLERRRPAMEKWGEFVSSKLRKDNVVQLTG